MPSLLILFISVMIMDSFALFASEIDPFKERDQIQLADMAYKINKKTQEYLEDSLAWANKRGACSEKRLFRGLRKSFRNHIFGELAPYIINSSEIERSEVRTTQSIYRNFKWYEALIPGLYAKVFSDPAGKIVNVNGHLIGTDKFEHFMGTGYKYFKTYYRGDQNLLEVLEKGWDLEVGFMGSVTTGVQSYADLVANFNGMRFWNHMLQKHEDILGENLGPYITCKNGLWVQIKKIDWRDYIEASWDEAYNCSKFRTQALLDKVQAVIAEYQKESSINLRCPLYNENLEQVVNEKYALLPPWSFPFLFNFEGHAVVEKDPN